MKHIIKPIIYAIFFTLSAQVANAKELIDCSFSNIDESDTLEFQIELREETFYMLPNQEGGYESELLFHTKAGEPIASFKITRQSATDPVSPIYHPRATFVELLGYGGVNTTTIDVITKEAWHGIADIQLYPRNIKADAKRIFSSSSLTHT